MAMSKLGELRDQILEDGKIDAEEVAVIKATIYEDGVIDAEEVSFLFELNDGVSGEVNDPGWKELFVEAIAANILEDGVIDEEETSLLVDKIQGDGTVDDVERALLEYLKSNAKVFPEELAKLLEK